MDQNYQLQSTDHIDLDPVKLQLLKAGQSPVIEDEIPEITAAAVKSGNLKVTDQLHEPS